MCLFILRRLENSRAAKSNSPLERFKRASHAKKISRFAGRIGNFFVWDLTLHIFLLGPMPLRINGSLISETMRCLKTNFSIARPYQSTEHWKAFIQMFLKHVKTPESNKLTFKRTRNLPWSILPCNFSPHFNYMILYTPTKIFSSNPSKNYKMTISRNHVLQSWNLSLSHAFS